MSRDRRFVWACVVAVVLAAPAGGQEKTDPYGEPLPVGAIARLGTSRGVVHGTNTFVALPPDYTRIAYVNRDHGVVIQDATTGRRLGTLGSKDSLFNSIVAASGNGKRLAVTAMGSGGTTVWDIETGQELLRYRPAPGAPSGGVHGSQSYVSLSKDGKRMAVGGWIPRKRDEKVTGSAVTVWDVDRNQLVAQVAVPEDLAVIPLLSADGTRLVTWPLYVMNQPLLPQQPDQIPYPRRLGGIRPGSETTVRVWDVASQKVLTRIDLPTVGPVGVALSPDAETIAISSGTGRIDWWDVQTNVQKPPLQESGRVGTPVFSPDGKTLAAFGEGGTVLRWATSNGRRLGEPTSAPHQFRTQTYGLGFSDAERVTVWGLYSHTPILWEAPTGRQISQYGANVSPVVGIGFKAGGKEVVTTSAGGIVTWDTDTGKSLGGYTPGPEPRWYAPHVKTFFPVYGISPDGVRGYTRTWPGAAVFDLATPRDIFDIPGSPDRSDNVFPYVTPDLTRLALLTVPGDRTKLDARAKSGTSSPAAGCPT